MAPNVGSPGSKWLRGQKDEEGFWTPGSRGNKGKGKGGAEGKGVAGKGKGGGKGAKGAGGKGYGNKGQSSQGQGYWVYWPNGSWDSGKGQGHKGDRRKGQSEEGKGGNQKERHQKPPNGKGKGHQDGAPPPAAGAAGTAVDGSNASPCEAGGGAPLDPVVEGMAMAGKEWLEKCLWDQDHKSSTKPLLQQAYGVCLAREQAEAEALKAKEEGNGAKELDAAVAACPFFKGYVNLGVSELQGICQMPPTMPGHGTAMALLLHRQAEEQAKLRQETQPSTGMEVDDPVSMVNKLQNNIRKVQGNANKAKKAMEAVDAEIANAQTLLAKHQEAKNAAEVAFKAANEEHVQLTTKLNLASKARAGHKDPVPEVAPTPVPVQPELHATMELGANLFGSKLATLEAAVRRQASQRPRTQGEGDDKQKADLRKVQEDREENIKAAKEDFAKCLARLQDRAKEVERIQEEVAKEGKDGEDGKKDGQDQQCS